MAAFERALAAALGEATPEPAPLDPAWKPVGSQQTPLHDPRPPDDGVEPTVMLDKAFPGSQVGGPPPSRTVIFDDADSSSAEPADVPEPTMFIDDGGLDLRKSSAEDVGRPKDAPMLSDAGPNVEGLRTASSSEFGPSKQAPVSLEFADAFDEPPPRRWVVPAIIGGVILAMGGGILVAQLLIGNAAPTAEEEIPVIGGRTAAAVPPSPSPSPALPTPPPRRPAVVTPPPPAPAPADPIPPTPSVKPPAPASEPAPAGLSRRRRGNVRSSLPESLSITETEQGLRRARQAVKRCADEVQSLPGMKVTAQFVVAGPTGKIIEAKALKPHEQTPLGRCVVKTLKAKVIFPRSRESRIEQSEEFVF